MKTIRIALFVTSILGLNAGVAPFVAGAEPSPGGDRCAAQQAAVEQAQVAMKRTPGGATASETRAVKADYSAKRKALECCRNPAAVSCAQPSK